MKPPAALLAFADEIEPAERLAAAAGLRFGLIRSHRFPDGETLPRVPAVSPTTILYRSLHHPDAKLVELLLAADAARRAGATRLVLVAPYMAYMRQDLVFRPGEPVSQQVVGRLLAGAFDRVISVDAHLHRVSDLKAAVPAAEAQDLSAAELLADWAAEEGLGVDALVVGPDQESARWVERAARRIGCPWMAMSKTRMGDREVAVRLDAPEAVAGRAILLLDDVCSSGTTLAEAARLLADAGAIRILVAATHFLGDASAVAALSAARVDRIAATDSVPSPVRVVHLAPVLAEALGREVVR